MTWEASEIPGSSPMPVHAVMQVKRNGDGTIDSFKARVVAGVNHQTYDHDYLEAYAPFVSFSVIKVFLYITLLLILNLIQVDVKTAFMNGALEKDIWMKSPCGVPGRPPRWCKLLRAIYSLEEAHLAWRKHLCEDLSKLGFQELAKRPLCILKESSK